MFEYTTAFLTPFKWARAAYSRLLAGQGDSTIEVLPEDLLASSVSEVSPPPPQIASAQQWNQAVDAQLSDLRAMYLSVDKAYDYVVGIQTVLGSKLLQTEKKIEDIERSLRVIRAALKSSASNSLDVRGGDLSLIDTDPDLYREAPLLERRLEEGVFALKDSGFFSSIRSLGGFAGSVRVDRSLAPYFTYGSLSDIVDGSASTVWMLTYLSPAPIKSDAADVPWLPQSYRHGFAFSIEYLLDRPTLATEVYVDPVTTDPFYLVSISYAPRSVPNLAPNPSFTSTGMAGWTLEGDAARHGFGGIGGSPCLLVQPGSGYAGFTFGILQAISLAPSGTITSPSSSLAGQRLEVRANIRASGDVRAGFRIFWLSDLGEVVSTREHIFRPAAGFEGASLVDYSPPHSASGRVEFGVFESSTPGSAWIDDVSVKLGEQVWFCNRLIDRTTTIPLPSSVLSDRFTFTFSQTNPRKERVVKEPVDAPETGLEFLEGVDYSLSKYADALLERFTNLGPGSTVWAYRLGLRELDLRYRQYSPRGSITTFPMKPKGEIRRLWAVAELSDHQTNDVRFYVQPFGRNSSGDFGEVPLRPFLINDRSTGDLTYSTEGDIVSIYTSEEVEAGWADHVSNYIVVDPKRQVEVFGGTDRDGKIQLESIPHLRRPTMRAIQKWLDDYSPLVTEFDPNAEVVYGLTDPQKREEIRLGNYSGVSSLDFVTLSGYIPIRVTVTTDRWTAVPDTLGRPTLSNFRYVAREVLGEASIVKTIEESLRTKRTYSEWTSATMVSAIANPETVGAKTAQTLTKLLGIRGDTTLRRAVQTRVWGLTDYFLRMVYNRLSDSGSPLVMGTPDGASSTIGTTTSTITKSGYQTKFRPLVLGPSGRYFRLFYYNPSEDLYHGLSAANFSVDAQNGIVELYASPPSSGFTQVVASYRYFDPSGTEDFFSSLVGPVFQASSGMIVDSDSLRPGSRILPITRNMTDYVTGKIPTLRPPDMDRLSKTYYPVIEYYITQGGELVLSTPFFKYGDEPAEIVVETETLGIWPRLRVDINRSGLPTSSPAIRFAGLRTQDGGTTQLRDVK